ncbi:MAG: DNA repair protein RecN [Propionibacteriaceae bacterium]|jgi:DNA repair protein RecN (Recombination protein N)|nr:DNA repair protein RecN [Propionibacteriaceae bacterium]
MLAELRIVDLGVIAEAVIEPGAGFTAVTGETGAGKTMVVTGLSLLAGAKADPKLVRAGASRALVEGRFSVDSPPGGASATLEELGAETEDGEVLIARQVGQGRSRASVGGAQVTLAQAEELLEGWLTIYGQLEQVRLASESRQREILDEYAGLDAGAGAEYRELWAKRRTALAELERLEAAAGARARELDMLRFGLEEIGRVGPAPGEDVALAAEAEKLQAVDELRLAAKSALIALAGDEDADADQADALALVAAAAKNVGQAAATDAALQEVKDLLADAAAGLADAAASISTYISTLEADPIRLEWIAGRRAELQTLRKYGPTVAEVLAWQEAAVQRVFELDSAEDGIARLRAETEALTGQLAALAAQLSAARKAGAEKLAGLVRAELAALAMPHARLEFEVSELPEPGPHGADRVQLLFSANPGAAPGPISKIASGGELSRVRLALEVVLAEGGGPRGLGENPTLVFDEVDAGIGGEVALEVGRRLKRLAGKAQVIAVTHLAQVAAFADRHFTVAKSDDGQVTTSSVAEVAGEGRLATLAKMMSGLSSQDALEHARQLLDTARAA